MRIRSLFAAVTVCLTAATFVGRAGPALAADVDAGAKRPRPGLSWHLSNVRVSAHATQNVVGNAFGLQVGLSPQVTFGRVPLGLRILAEYGALSARGHRYFSVPSAHGLLTLRPTHRLELGLGGGVQFWLAPAERPVVRPVGIGELHYVPSVRPLRFVRSVYVAAALGAPSRAGLQVRAGIECALPRPRPRPPREVDAPSPTAPPAPAPAPPPIAPPLLPTRVAEAAPEATFAGPGTELEHRLLFAFNSAALGAADKAYLTALAEALRACEAEVTMLHIVAHADSVGTPANVRKVAAARGQAVAAFLAALGVPTGKLALRVVAAEEPVAHIDAKAHEQRRVVLRLEHSGPAHALQVFVAKDLQARAGAQP